MNADRNLLFGILAFQNNFIDREALLAAFDRWTTHKARSLGQILVELGKLETEHRELLDGLVAVHLKLHGGDAEKSLAAVSSLGSVSADLRRIADPDMDASLAHVRAASPADDPYATRTVSAGTSSSSGLRFTVLRAHAKGGLGQVSVALDKELDREVAFKEIQDRHADNPDSRGRFLLEAKVTGGLEHPGIVPVYGLGHYGDGRPFYAMRFIKGDSLNDAVKRFHQANAAGRDLTERTAELRKLLGRFVDVCNAIEYAHSRGVLHRDLKPGNVMLGHYGETLVVDWGLAKVIGKSETPSASNEPAMKHSLSGGSAATQMGQAIGTPQYMSPEQAAGRWDELGRESDVYSLGATLYTLLTGQAPIGDSESMDVLARAVKGDFPAPRTVNKQVPPALEAICLKAMALKPADRYRSPRALADDIERWLNDLPVSVYREPPRQRFARWRRNHRTQVAALAAAVVVLVMAGVVGSALSRRSNERTENATRGKGLVEQLVSADPQQVPEIIKQLGANAEWTKPLLEGKLAQVKDDSTEKLHLSLALVGSDEGPVENLVEYLYEQLLSGHVSYVGVIRDQLAPYEQRFEGELWKLLHDGTAAPARRFRAGLALATNATASEQWTAADNAFLVEQLVAENPEHQARLRDYLRPLHDRLLGDLERIFADPKATESHRLSAANAFADYAGGDIARLSQLLAVATPPQYAVLYGIVAATPAPSTVDDLGKIAARQPPALLGSVERVPFGQRRANAAVTLLRLGQREKVLPVFDMTDDPEALTQFIFRCRERGIGAEALLDCLQRLSDAPQDRYPGHARYALLLALGEFSLDEIPASRREALLRQLTDWYRQDPNSGVHGAAGWLLRQWGQAEVARQVDQTAVPYAPDREWFTLAITVAPTAPPRPPEEPAENKAATEPPEKDTDKPAESGKPAPPQEETKPETSPEPPKTFYYTFIVFPAGDYEIGSVNDEPDRLKIEVRHPVKLTRCFALLDREVTLEELIAFKPVYTGFMRQFDAKPADAGFGADWYDAVGFCRWLGQQSGLSEGDQSYADPETLRTAQYPREPSPVANWAPRNWPLELGRRGFRLPTETEWEVASRSGARTSYGFGSEVSLLGRFGWFTENSGKHVHPPRELRPSLRGLFDLYGNLFEWTHDWYGDYGVEAIIDPLGAKEGSYRVSRGGGWDFVAASCRAAFRITFEPSYRSLGIGFRLALSPSGVTPEAVQDP